VSNVLSDEKRQQVIALGRLGWPLRRIETETGVRRETASGYLKAAGIAIRPSGAWGRRSPAKPANGVSPDLADPAKPANEVSPDSGTAAASDRRSGVSRCEPYLEFIDASLAKGRNAKAIWQDLVDDHGFSGRYASVKRFVRKLRGGSSTQARAVIVTPPGEDYGKSRVMLRAAAATGFWRRRGRPGAGP
jgi:transposase